jgi:hypothetical protein
LQTAVDVAVEDRLLVVAVRARRSISSRSICHRALVLLHAVAVEDAHFHDRAEVTRRHAHGRVAHVRGLFAEDGAQQLFFRRHRAFALGRDLADQDVARPHFGADIDDARLVEVFSASSPTFGMSRVISSGPSLVSRAITSNSSMWMEVNTSSRTMLLGEKDRVLVVVAVPGHERDEHVAAERQVAQIGRRTVGDDVALADHVTDAHQRTLVDAGVLVGTLELLQTVDIDARLGGIEFFGRADNDTHRIDLVDDTAAACGDGGAGVASHDRLHAGADERRFGAHQRHRLTLHVRAHERAVGVVVFQERNESGGDRNELLRRHVHQVDLFARGQHHVAGMAADDEFADEGAVFANLRIGLGDVVLRLFHGGQIDDLIGHLAVRSCGTGFR